MNRADTVKAIVWLEQVAAAAAAEAAKRRDELLADAADEYQQHGSIPTYRLPDLGTVSLSVSQAAVVVSDESAFADWVGERHPNQVVPKVRPAWQRQFLARLHCDEGIVTDDDGEVIPGLVVRPGGQPRYVAIRPSNEAIAAFSASAGEGLRQLAASSFGNTTTGIEVSDA